MEHLVVEKFSRQMLRFRSPIMLNAFTNGSRFIVSVALCSLFTHSAGGATDQNAAPVAPNAPAAPATAPASANTSATADAAQRDALYQLAFEIATSIPADPHIRDRSLSQQVVARSCLESGLLQQAEKYTDSIDGWRQGEMFALIAKRNVELSHPERARVLAQRALHVAAAQSNWSRDHVRCLAAQVFAMLGEDEQARALIPTDAPAALGQLEATRTAALPSDQLDAQADLFDKAIATKNFDLARSGLDGYMAWLGRTMDDETRRTRALRALDEGIKGLPADLQVTYTVALAELLWRRNHRDLSEPRLAHAADIVATTKFDAEDVVPVGVATPRARMRMGQKDAARAELVALRASFDAQCSQIVDIRRAASLRALAEAFAQLGDKDAALTCAADALKEGARNPNARPRAMDLCHTCVALAAAGITPPPAMLEKIASIRNALTDPW